MKNNMNILDRIIRGIAAIVVAYMFYTHVITGTWGIVLLVVAGIFLLTSIIGSCPLYSLFGFSTCNRKEHIN